LPNQATQIIVLQQEPRLVAGTRAGAVLEFSAFATEDRVEFAGLDGQPISALAEAHGGSAIMAFDVSGRGLVWDRRDRRIVDELRSPNGVVKCAGFGRATT